MDKFSSQDFIAPYRCYMFLINDLGFNQNDTFLPGLVANGIEESDPSFVGLIVCSISTTILCPLVCFGVYKTSPTNMSVMKKLFIYVAVTDTILGVITLLNSIFFKSLCERNLVILAFGVYSLSTRILALCFS